MTRASICSAGLAVLSIVVQSWSLAVAGAGARAAAMGHAAAPEGVMLSGTGSRAALILAIVAAALAMSAWTHERSPVRVSVLCLSFGAILFALLIV